MAVSLTPEQDDLLKEVVCKFEAADTTHRRHREQWDRLDELYHSRRRYKDAHAAAASPRDRDAVLDGMRAEFGPDLLIPYAFSTVETVLPRMLSNRPRMLFTPRSPASEKNTENIRIILDAQQQQSNYELKLQSTGRSGLVYGLGVQKGYWRRETAQRKRLTPRTYGDVDGAGGYAVDDYQAVLWDDPDVDDVSIWDFLWDPYGDSMDTIGYAIHRSWRSTAYVLAKVQSGWGEVALTAEDLEGAGAKERYVGLWQRRWDSQGHKIDLKETVHEVWEVHLGGQRVVTVVNRQWPVSVAANPAWHGRMPFTIFRPTEVLHQFCGKGEIEPIEDLSYEMNMLRSNRLLNALFKLHASYFYEDGALDPDAVKIGPGEMIPVANQNGSSLRDLLVPVTVGDIPNSSYQEEQALQADMERVSGISDPVSGGSGADQTATGIQLIQAAAGLRIQNKTRRLELETILPMAEMWLALDQQHIREVRDVAVPMVSDPGQPDRRWSWRQIGPDQLAGEWNVEPDGGSTAPENVPQMRADATMLQSLLGAPGLDPRKLLLLILEKLGVKAPESLLAPDVRVPPQTLDLIAQQLQEAGMPSEQVQQIVSGALNAALDAEDQTDPGGGQAPAPMEQQRQAEQAAA